MRSMSAAAAAEGIVQPVEAAHPQDDGVADPKFGRSAPARQRVFTLCAVS